MEGAPFIAAETPDERRNEALDTDDSKNKKDKDKKKKKDSVAIHLPRLDVERPAELAAEKRQKNDKKDLLGGVSLGSWDLGPKNETTHKYEAIIAKEKHDAGENAAYSPVVEAETILKASAGEQETDDDNEEVAEEATNEQSDTTEIPEETNETPLDIVESEDVVEEVPGDIEEESDDTVAASSATSSGSSGSWSSSSTPTSASTTATSPPPPPTPFSGGSSTGSSSGPASSAGTSTTPPVPPVPPVPSGATGGYNTYPASPVATPNLAPTSKVEQHIIEKHNHFWTGVVVGGLYEHFKHKKREKKLNKKLEQQDTELAKTTNQQVKTEEEMHKLRAQQLEQAAEAKWLETHPEPSEKTQIEQNTASKVGDIVTESTKAAAEAMAALPLQPSGEKSQPFTVYERGTASPSAETAKVATEKLPANPEAKPIAIEPDDEPAHVDDSRRVETSSWHRMEIDKATGKVVEDPSLAYGEAFQAERHQEIKAQTDDSDGPGMAATGLGLLGSHAIDATQAAAAAGSNTSSGRAEGTPQQPVKTTAKTAHQTQAVGAGLWLVLAVLVVLIIVVVF